MAAGTPEAPSLGHRLVLSTALRALASPTALVVGYYLLPWDRGRSAAVLSVLGLGMLALVALLGWQLRRILRSPHPGMRAVVALSTTIPLFLLVFASAYFLLARDTPAAFSEPLDRTDALYFTVTVFATVGFGDIAPVTAAARVATTVQMVLDLLVLGGLLRIVLGAVRLSQRRRSDGTGGEPTRSPGP